MRSEIARDLGVTNVMGSLLSGPTSNLVLTTALAGILVSRRA